MADEYARALDLVETTAAATAASASSTFTTPPTDIETAQYPDQPSAAYLRMQPWWELCRTLMAGTDAVREAGEVFLPRLAGEADDEYDFRLQLCALFPGFARTVKASVGLINQTAPILGEDMPDALVALAENVDRQGTALAVFARELTKDGVVDGFAGILVDYPRVDAPDSISLDDERKLGLRPYFVLIRADDVIKTMHETVDGIRTLVLLVLREVSEVADPDRGAFGQSTLTRYRVYRRTGPTVTYQLWEKRYGEAYSHSVGDPVPMRNITAIPWAPFIAGERQNATTIRPALLDLAYLNIEHYQIKTNIRNLEALALVPTQVRIGATPDANGKYPQITVGPRSTIEAPLIQGVPKPVYWNSPDTTVLQPANASLANTEAAMGTAGLSFLAPDTRSAETAAAKRIDSTAQNATITSVAGALQDCLEAAFGFAGQYLKVTAGSVTVNTDYENTVMDAAMVTALGALAVNGKLDIETLLNLLEDGHVLPDGTDKPAILRRILTENMAEQPTPALTPPTNPSGGDPANPTSDQEPA